jgi:hypothetical protein
LEVWLLDENGNQIEQIFFTNTEKKVAKMVMELWRSKIDRVTRCGSSLSCKFDRAVVTEDLTYAVVDAICAPLYSNPLSTDEYKDLNGGSLIAVNPNVKLTTTNTDGDPMTLVQVVKSDLGPGGWVEEKVISSSIQPEAAGDKNYPASKKYKEQVEEATTSGTTSTTSTFGSNPGNDKQVGRSRYDGSTGDLPIG